MYCGVSGFIVNRLRYRKPSVKNAIECKSYGSSASDNIVTVVCARL
jgi:hypothetical protein